VEVAEDPTSFLIEVAPQAPIAKADVEPALFAPSVEGPAAAENAPVEDAQNEELAITQEPIPARSLQEEMASESSVIGDTALVSQESIAAPEESNTAPIVEEDSTPVAENQPIDETALPIENVVEEITVPEPIAEESPAIAEITLESTIPIVEPPSVVDQPESPAADAGVSEQAALIAEGESTPLPVVEPVLASASPVMENLAVPEAEEFISLDTVEEVEAASDEDSQPIYDELVAEAEVEAPSVDPVIPAPDTAAICDSETMKTETPSEQPSGAENLFSTEAEAETVEDPASTQESIAEIDEPASLQVEESPIAELEPGLVDSSPIEAELEELVTRKSPRIEGGNVELVPNTPPFEESVATGDALVEDALVQEAPVEHAHHEESTTVHDDQGAVVSEPNLVDDSGSLESRELIGAEEPDTGPIVEEDSAPVAENQLVDKTAHSNESVVEDSKDEVEAPIAEDSPAVTEIPLEATVPVVDALSLVHEPELPTSDVDIGGGKILLFLFLHDANIFDLECSDFGSAPELTSEVGGGTDLTISEILEVPKGDLEYLFVHLSSILMSIPLQPQNSPMSQLRSRR
jgi:hypothetical protein